MDTSARHGHCRMVAIGNMYVCLKFGETFITNMGHTNVDFSNSSSPSCRSQCCLVSIPVSQTV